MIRRTLLLAAAFMLAFAGVASAGYDAPSGSTTTDGETITVTVGGFQPGSTVTVTITDDDGNEITSGTGTADENGNVVINLPAPEVRGVYTVRATGPGGDGNPVTVVAGTVNVGQQGTTTSGGTLPATGSDSSLPLARLGIVLIAAGAVAVYAGQKRRSKMTIDA